MVDKRLLNMEQRTAHDDIKQILQLRISFLTIRNAQLFTVKFFFRKYPLFYWKVLTKDIRMTKTNTPTFLYQRSITSPTAIHYPQKNCRLLFHEQCYQHCETAERKHLKYSVQRSEEKSSVHPRGFSLVGEISEKFWTSMEGQENERRTTDIKRKW